MYGEITANNSLIFQLLNVDMNSQLESKENSWQEDPESDQRQLHKLFIPLRKI